MTIRVLGRQLKDYDLPYVLKTTDPSASDTGYPTPCLWVNTADDKIWFHYGGGVWEQIYTPATIVINADVDTGTETCDSFADTAGKSAVWEYSLDNGPGTNMRSGTIRAVWNTTADSSPSYEDTSTSDIGDTSGVSFAVDKSTNTVRLRCTAGSDNWMFRALRLLI